MESVVREINGIDKDTVTEIKAQAQEAMDKVKAPAKVTCSGKVTGKISYSLVGDTAKLEAGKTATTETEVEVTA